jgi:N-acetylneuraminic acid mutarotase
MTRRLWYVARRLLAVAVTVTMAGMVLAGTAPAQAQARAVAAATSGTRPAWPKDTQVTPATADTRAVCGKVRVGYSTCMSVVRTNVRHYLGLRPAATPPAGYGPADLRSAYDLPSATAGSGETVAIVDAYDDPRAEADLQVYRAQYHLPVCDTANGCFAKVNQDGLASPLPPAAGTAGPDSAGWDAEESLDLDMVSAICPNCHILLVEANSEANRDLYTAEDTAVALGARFVSNSWAGLEYDGETAEDSHFNHPGVVITAAAGDDGYGTLYPAASRYVTAVGGTALTQDSQVARGWTETAWGGTGSGCSSFEPKPAWQKDKGCPNRTETDVSAVADPYTGVAVYDSYDGGGWGEYGGTSVATPLIAATYALAGLPAAGSYPSSYPYRHPSDLNNITEGVNAPSPCGPPSLDYLCEAGPGYNGPTGLGTPDGVAAFASGVASGTISGTVSAGASGMPRPLSGATVTAGGYTATTGPSGRYVLTVPDGSYTVSARAFGDQSATVGSVSVTHNQATTENFALTAVLHYYTVSGTVTDGSGHHWPVYASISVGGYKDVAAYTSPYTGRYSLSLPEQGSYTLTATPVYPGYGAATASVAVGTADVTRSFQVGASVNDDPGATCSAPGYHSNDAGTTETFTGWTTTPQDGWTVTDPKGNGEVWTFDNPTQLPDPVAGDADFASIDPAFWAPGGTQNTSLVSPVVSLAHEGSPAITFDTYYSGSDPQTGVADQAADVDLSLDGGTTWSTVWQQRGDFGVAGLVSVPIPQAAGQSRVRVRFHFTQTLLGDGGSWEVGNVFVGTLACSPTPGGLVTGLVTDHNTGKPVNYAAVVSNAHPGQSGTSSASPDDPALPGGGFYWLFVSPAGKTLLTTRDVDNYASAYHTVDVAADAVTRQDWPLQAGDLAAQPGSVSVTQAAGTDRTAKVRFTDTGTEPVQVNLSGLSSGFTALPVKAGDQAAVRGAPLEQIPGHYLPSLRPLRGAAPRSGTTSSTTRSAGVPDQATSAGPAWASIPSYPLSIEGNAVGYDPDSGNVYSAGGADDTWYVSNAYVYNPLQQQWKATAPLPQPLFEAAGAFAGGKFYVLGGVRGETGGPSRLAYAYQPSTHSWSRIAGPPAAVWGSAAAVLNDSLYLIGGADATSHSTDGMYRYNPSANSWTALAPYPVATADEACAGIDGEIVCAGGINLAGSSEGSAYASTYVYNPATNAWSQGAAMPYDDWGMDYAGSGGMLQIAGGVTGNSTEITNQAAQYNPAANAWTTLPNARQAEYDGGGSCGLYQVGGVAGIYLDSYLKLLRSADVLPGYDSCGTGPIPWLSLSASSFTLQPGQSKTVTVTTKATAGSRPGTYTAQLTVETSTPYQISPLKVAMTVTPPST